MVAFPPLWQKLMNIRALIIEDEPLALQTLADFAKEFAWLEIIGTASDGLTAVRLIDELKPQLIFLDVQIPEITGLEVLRRIKYQPFIVFTTAFDDYALTAFEFEAIDYLQKPFGLERFRQTVERVERRIKTVSTQIITPNNEPLNRIFVRDKRGLIPLAVEEIVWLKADDDYTIIYTKDSKYLVGTNLKDFAAKFNADKFLRIHRSAVVNLDHIERIEEDNRRLILYMKNGNEVQASRAGSQILKKLFA
jgi:two-component system, LytTR family, response regulator